MKKVLVIIAIAASLIIHVFMVREFSMVTRDVEGGVNWLMVLIFFGVMLLGILGREAYNMLVNQKPFNWTSMAIAFIVSPMIFGVVYGVLGNLKVDVPSVINAFQNGFFWNTIFEGLGPKQ